jgi:hypothetical protein
VLAWSYAELMPSLVRPTNGYADPVSVSSVARSYVGPIAACDYPRWARSSDELRQRDTLGVEEDFMLLDPVRWWLVV